jgi:hypothetical protein
LSLLVPADTLGMSVSLARTHVSVPEHVMTRAVSGSTVLLDIDSGRSFTLDSIGTRVWNLLAESGSPRVAYDTLINEFAVAPQALERDLESLIGELARHGLLQLDEEHP